ncbi:hypothetical protein VaNZ11_012377 [Volvox africanus]|uniref:Exocyst complex component EXOC2/Sec5 N-terminal domain-containing protein n=1 Tax=Volvox africanus TaxID=51714 RepID=A0ABQ5SDT6_9CHLO|nr:hypothetical protein VaNZ11_012377 [Volvox africanus]
MASDDSDVSAITLSEDDEPRQKLSLPLKPPSKAAGEAVGSSRLAVTGADVGSNPSRKRGQGKGHVGFQLDEGVEEEDGDGEGRDADRTERNYGYGDGDDGGDEDDTVEDETKPLGWSYFRKRDATEGPATWGEVDVGELRFVAENLVRSTTKRASQADDVIQQIFQSAPGDEESLVPDPLGRGVIDPVTLTLGKRSKMQAARQVQPSSGERGLKATIRTFRTARLGAVQQQQQQQGASEGAGRSQLAASAATSSGLDEETRKVLPNQEGFDPEAYLATFHSESSMKQLEKGLRSLGRELSERTGQLKLLIRNNFERFINCKDAIDDIHAKMRKTLVRGSAGGPPGAPSGSAALPPSQQQQQQTVATERVFRSLEQVEGQARRTFGPILDRAAKADRIRAVASLLQRFDHLFAAPQRVMELASRGELEQVVREYKRANMLIRPTPTTARVWVSLYAEIEKRVTEVYLAVKQLVTEPPPEDRPMGQDGPVPAYNGASSNPNSFSDDAARQRLSLLPDYLLFLALIRQERLPAAREEDAMRLYLSRLETHVTARIQDCDKQHTDRLGQLVNAWMRATMGTGPAGGAGNSSTAVAATALRAASNGIASLQASFTAIPRLDAQAGAGHSAAEGGAKTEAGTATGNGPDSRSKAQGRSGDDNKDNEDSVDDELDLSDRQDGLDEEAETAEVAFLQWQGGRLSLASSAFLGHNVNLPYHIRTELRRLIQIPGSLYGIGDGQKSLYDACVGGGGASGGASAVEPLPPSAFAPEPCLTSAQSQWVSYVCSVSALLRWSVPGLWATCNSPKYDNNADLSDESRESLNRGPSLARRLVESLCIKYAARLRRAAQSLARAGPMQPGLPLIIKDGCHLWSSLRQVGIAARTLSSLRGSVLMALAAHVRVLEDHLAGLPQNLFGADDFRLDLLGPDHQPVTSLPRRVEEEVGVAMLHYQWSLAAVAEAVGGVSEVPAESGWRPMQDSVFSCFSLLSEALAEYARSLYSSQADEGKDVRNSFRSKASGSLNMELEAASSVALAGSQTPSTPPGPGSQLGPAVAKLSGTSSLSNLSPGSLHRVTDVSEAEGSRGHGALWSASGGGSGNDDVRVLLVIGNSAVIRTRVMPGVLERYRKLLAPTSDAASRCQRRLRDLTSAMRRSNEALGSSYLARKEADVQAAVQSYIAAATAPLLPATRTAATAATGAGAGAGAAAGGFSGSGVVPKRRAKGEIVAEPGLLPGPSGPSTGCSMLLQLLTAIHNEALAYSPSNLRSFMEALAERLVGELVSACRRLSKAAAGRTIGKSSAAVAAAADASIEQLVQLWADLRFLSALLRPLLTETLVADIHTAKEDLGAAIAAEQSSRRYRPASKVASTLADLRDGKAVNSALEELLLADVDAWLRLHALNVRCFAAAVAPAAPLPGPAAAMLTTVATTSQGTGALGITGVEGRARGGGERGGSTSSSRPPGKG